MTSWPKTSPRPDPGAAARPSAPAPAPARPGIPCEPPAISPLDTRTVVHSGSLQGTGSRRGNSTRPEREIFVK